MKEVLVTLLAILLAAWIGWGVYVNSTAESLDYTVTTTLNGVELREYPSQLTATVTAGDRDEAFRILADYIFGNNVAMTAPVSEKIAMTTPVKTSEKIAMTAPVRADQTTMTFFMPKGYSLSTLPKPKTSRITIEQLPPQTIAVVSFGGYALPYIVERKKAQLLKTLEKNNIKMEGEPFLLFYNDPWTPPFMRKNEVAVVLS